MEKILQKLAQISNLCYYLNCHSKLNVVLVFNGTKDYLKVKIKDNNDREKFSQKIESISKKSENYVLKEMELIAEILVKFKEENE